MEVEKIKCMSSVFLLILNSMILELLFTTSKKKEEIRINVKLSVKNRKNGLTYKNAYH